ncbi:S-adenosyl-L-methionine-dependent methyltransferase [Nemania sp. FL0916]|nr:S-adenosyl-L-methionine-dependent methyltransferase [Nemania sp. FL0916]
MSQSDQKTRHDPPMHDKLDWSKFPEDVFRFLESRTATNSAAFLLPTLKEMVAAATDTPGTFRMLDVGAGAGSMTADFARIIAPCGGHITGVDFNPIALSRAATVANERGISSDKISFQEADGYKLPFEDGTFDVVHCHQVLVHNKNPWKILTEMLRVTKPGGVCAAREGDLDTEIMWPPLPGLLQFQRALKAKLIVARGGCATAGRELLSWALRTGAKRSQIKTSYSTWSYTEPEDRKLWASGIIDVALGPAVREKNVASGISLEEMDEMRAAWLEWVDRDDAVLAQLIGEVIIRKE